MSSSNSTSLGNNKMDDSGMMEVTGKILITTIIALVFVLVFVFLFHIYARWLWSRRQHSLNNLHQRRQGQHQHQHPGVTVLRRGLDVAFLKTLPVIEFDPKEFKNGVLECSVCINEVEQGEKTRILPKCNHAFHAECIDMWFHSHSTCPICRNPVSEQTEISVESLLEQEQSTTSNTPSSTDSHTFPTNVLFWGDETEVSTLTSQLEEATNNQAPVLPFQPTSSSSSSNDRLVKEDLVIDIPRNMVDVTENEEDQKTPILSRMRSLRRILSSSSRRFNPFSPVSSNNNNSS
ncbi:RING-H2 finger protein ATL3-like protein [Tanacetum coccineum]